MVQRKFFKNNSFIFRDHSLSGEGRVGWRRLEPALTYLDVLWRKEGWVEGVGACSDLPWCRVERGGLGGGGCSLLWPTLLLDGGIEPAPTYLDVVWRGEGGVEGGGACSGHHCWFCPKAGGRGCDSNSSGVGISTWPRTWPRQIKTLKRLQFILRVTFLQDRHAQFTKVPFKRLSFHQVKSSLSSLKSVSSIWISTLLLQRISASYFLKKN